MLWVIFTLKYVISSLIKMQEYQQNMSDVILPSGLKKFATVEGQCWCHFMPALE